MPESLTPGAGPFPSTPGIAPSSSPPGGGVVGVPDWLRNIARFITDPFGTAKTPGGGVPAAMAPSVEPQTASPGRVAAGMPEGPSPAQTFSGGGQVVSGLADSVTKLPSKIGNSIADRLGLPGGGVNWQSVGVYLALFVLLAIGVTSLLNAAKEG